MCLDIHRGTAKQYIEWMDEHGKPLDEKYEMGIQMLGFGLMILLSVYVTFNDIHRII